MNGTHRVGWWVGAALLSLLGAQTAWAQTAEQTPSGAQRQAQSVQRFRLANGLDVMLDPRPDGTHVAVHLRYHVGTRDQPHGYTGLAHLTEHLMFEPPSHGSRHFIALLEAMGATHMNGVTTPDSTSYFEDVPAQQLQRTLWLESERMGYLFSRLSTLALAAQKRVVRNEDRERMVGARGRYFRAISSELYPEGHPYFERTEHSEDLDAITLENIRWFHERYYTPANATLIVVGPFDRDRTRAWIEQYFAPIVGGPAPQRGTAITPTITSERRVTVDARVFSDRLDLRWITSRHFDGDDAALDLIAYILGHQAIGRLQRRLVNTLDFAEDVSVSQLSYALSSEFAISVQCTEEHDADDALRIVDEELDRLRTALVSDVELAAAKRAFIDSLGRANDTPSARAGQLAQYSDWSSTEPDMTERDIARYRSITAEQLRNVARTTLASQRRVVARLHRSLNAPSDVALASGTTTETQTALQLASIATTSHPRAVGAARANASCADREPSRESAALESARTNSEARDE